MIRKGSITYLLLIALEKTIERGTPLMDFLTNPHSFVWTGYRTNLNYSSFYRSVRLLREKGYIETQKDGRKLLLKLTDKGKEAIILEKLLDDKKWDGKWRIIIFDIPEKHRKIRNTLRSQLKRWEFKQLQKSVWVTKKDIIIPLKNFIEEVGVSDWVKVFVASEIK